MIKEIKDLGLKASNSDEAGKRYIGRVGANAIAKWRRPAPAAFRPNAYICETAAEPNR